VNPLMGLALAPAEQPSLDDLERIGLHIDQEKPQPILRRRQRTILVGRVPPGGARLPLEAPVGHVALERRLKAGDQRLKLVHGETGQSQDLRRAGLEIGEPSRAHNSGLLSLEAPYTLNRDELSYVHLTKWPDCTIVCPWCSPRKTSRPGWTHN
jgi:hypothetical protein